MTLPNPEATKGARGYCPRCHGAYVLTEAGLLRAHNRRSAVTSYAAKTRCEGSGQEPSKVLPPRRSR